MHVVCVYRSGNFSRANNCLLKANQNVSPKVFIQTAKIFARKGEKEQAISILEQGISTYFPVDSDFRKKDGRSRNPDMSKLCSKALLLFAVLGDQQKRVDFEMNVQNYKSAIEACSTSEKNYFTLGSYYDRIWSNAEEPNKHT